MLVSGLLTWALPEVRWTMEMAVCAATWAASPAVLTPRIASKC